MMNVSIPTTLGQILHESVDENCLYSRGTHSEGSAHGLQLIDSQLRYRSILDLGGQLLFGELALRGGRFLLHFGFLSLRGRSRGSTLRASRRRSWGFLGFAQLDHGLECLQGIRCASQLLLRGPHLIVLFAIPALCVLIQRDGFQDTVELLKGGAFYVLVVHRRRVHWQCIDQRIGRLNGSFHLFVGVGDLRRQRTRSDVFREWQHHEVEACRG
mmetsp:Transcript_4704/g.6446  ORF Transcript_4704/g.6446 Transcript_4704/m.6446 type:complete len:214 (-) Transcript_4704:1395-2036(-)